MRRALYFVLLGFLTMPVWVKQCLALDSTQAVRPDVTIQSTVPVGLIAAWPVDGNIPPGWLPCNGQAVPSQYPQLKAIADARYGGRIPDLNEGQFLRGAKSGAGNTFEDTTRDHQHWQPAESHSFDLGLRSTATTGNLVNSAVEGTAAGQRQHTTWTGVNGTGSALHDYLPGLIGAGGRVKLVESQDGSPTFIDGAPPSRSGLTAEASKLVDTRVVNSATSGRVSDGTVVGSIVAHPRRLTEQNLDNRGKLGGTETAPKHILVKYLIKHD